MDSDWNYGYRNGFYLIMARKITGSLKVWVAFNTGNRIFPNSILWGRESHLEKKYIFKLQVSNEQFDIMVNCTEDETKSNVNQQMYFKL